MGRVRMRCTAVVHPFHHGYSLAASVISGIARVIEQGGMEALTMRAIAAEVRMAPSGIHYALGSRDEMLGTAAVHFGDRVLGTFEHATHLSAMLPDSPETLGPARVWLAFRELGRSHPGVGAAVADIDRRERAWIARTFDDYTSAGRDTARVRALHACGLGLREAMCSPGDPMPPELARSILARIDADTGLEALVPSP